MNRLFFNYLPILFLTFLSFSGVGQVMISQYIETNSGSTPKGVEIFNYGLTDIVFSPGNNLQVFQGTNGGSCSAISSTNTTTGTLKAGEVWVIGTSDLTSYATSNGTDLSGTTTYGFSFNGDDALQIYLGGVLMDVFGTCGSDPGNSWTGGGVDTRNNNIQTKTGICTGTTSNWTDPSVRFENVANGSTMTGFGNAPSSCSSSTAPTGVSTGTAGSITATSAIISGNDVGGDGGDAISERGVVYGTSANPTIADNKQVESGTTGTFTATLSGLNSSTTYFARAFATNSVGTTYGSDVSFTTNAPAGDTDSDIIENSSFTYTDNVDYTSYVNSGPLTTGNSFELAQFTIRDGGAGGDADALTTTLTNLDLSITNHANLNRIAIFDGTTNVAEVAAASSVSFSSLSLQAADNSTKDFSVRVSFQSTVTDNEQVDVTITAATAQAGASLFAAADAGGASSSSSGDNNRIEVTATDLVFDQQPTNVNVGEVMSPSPTVKAVDGNANLDLDFSSSISLSTTGTFDGSATISATPNNGVGTFSNLIFSAASSGSTITATAAGVNQDVSSTFDVIEITEGWQITNVDSPYLIDFDNSVTNVNNGQYNGTGISSSPSSGQLNSSGWAISGLSEGDLAFDGSNTSGDFARGISSGGETSGGLYAFEVSTSNYVLGFQSTSSDFAPGTITLKVQNQTGNTINSISLSYKVYEYNDQGRSSDLDFSYSTDNSSYSNIPNIDFTSTEVADGSPTWNSTLMVTTISSLNITDGSFLYLRWTSDDVSGSGSRDEIALDDISLVVNPSTNTASLGGEINNLNINGDISLSSNLFVQNNLTFNSGKIELGSRNITVLGNISGASSTNYILADGSGVVKQGVENGAPKTYPVGTSNYYIPITINQRGTADTISIRVEEQVYADGSSGTVQTSDALDVSWLIEEKTEGGSTVDLTVQWPSTTELSNFDPTACFFSHYRNGAWYPGDAQDVSGNDPRTITLTDVNSFSPFAIGSGNSPLPVELAYFRGNQFNNSLRLTWQTYSETGIENFLIKHKNENVAKTRAAGSSNFTQNYEVTLAPKSLNFPLIYELWEQDKNGKETKLAVAEINNLQKEGIYIEQTKNELTVRLERSAPIQLQIFDIQGKLIIKEENLTQTKSFVLPQKGIYLVNLFDDYFFTSKKIIQE